MIAKRLFDEKFLRGVMAMIRAAKKEVYIITYMMTPPDRKLVKEVRELYEELAAAREKGRDVRVLLNYTEPPSKVSIYNKASAAWLRAKGISCRHAKRNRTVHAKMVIIDGVTLVIGSHNWSERAMNRNVEASVKVKESKIVKEARERFLELWEGAARMEIETKGE